MKNVSRLYGGHLREIVPKMKRYPSYPSDEFGSQLVNAARACLGTPVRHQGRLPGVGLDCVGLVAAVARAQGLTIPDIADYGASEDGEMLLDHAAGAGFRLTDDPRPGDVAVMRLTRAARHLGILTESGLIHAWAAAGSVVEHGLDAAWAARIVHVLRFPRPVHVLRFSRNGQEAI